MKIKRNNFSSTWNKTFVGFETSDFGFIWNRMWSVVWLRGCCERVWRERGELQIKTTMKKSCKNVFKSSFVAGSWGWVDEMSKFKIATPSAPRTQTDHRSNPGSSKNMSGSWHQYRSWPFWQSHSHTTPGRARPTCYADSSWIYRSANSETINERDRRK